MIDNSSAFRMDPEIPLVVPEINGSLLEYKPQIISNPNCSTIQLVLVLHPLHQAFSLLSVRVVSLQSMSGAGQKALESLKDDTRQILEGKTSYATEKPLPGFNCTPYIGELTESGFCTEELKIHNETKKILGLPDLEVSAFTTRVPTLNSHGEVVSVKLEKKSVLKEEIPSGVAFSAWSCL